MELEIKEAATDTLELILGEELERQKVAEFQEICKKQIDDGKIHLKINLSNVKFIDSSGLGMLIGLRAHAKARHGSISLSGINPGLHEIFHRTRMDVILGLDAQ